MSLYNTCTFHLRVDLGMNKGNSHEYIHTHVKYTYNTMSLDSYVPFMELQFKLYKQRRVVNYYENAYFNNIGLNKPVHLHFITSWIW